MVNRVQQRPDGSDTTVEAMAASDEPRGANRRQHVRVPGPFDAWRISVLPIPVQIYDLSPGGCFVNSLNEQMPGIRVVLEIELPGEGRIKVTGETLYAKPDFGYAVRFVDMPSDLAARIEAALRRLNEE
jgi:PilZ domain